MTDNSKIEIGIYPKDLMLGGEIQKNHNIKYEPLNVNTQKIFDMVYENETEEPVCYVPVRKGVPRNAELFDNHKFIKASFNIIDLIEVGDYVNGKETEQIIGNELYFETSDMARIISFKEKDIKSVITHEQFDAMKYEVK